MSPRVPWWRPACCEEGQEQLHRLHPGPEREQYGLAVADISTGEIHAAQFTDPDNDSTLKNELSRFAPNEIVFHPAFLDKKDDGGVYP